MKLISKLWIGIILMTYGGVLLAQNKIAATISNMEESKGLQSANIGISVVNLETGKSVVQHQAQKSLIPASTLKVLTTASALALLGPDFQFKTQLYLSGSISSDGILDGDVIIRGLGDPTLGSDQMKEADELDKVTETMRLELQKKGIRGIKGRVIVDASYFHSAVNASTWQWNDLGNYYASGAWGLNIHENFYYLKLRQNPTLGQQPTIASVRPLIEDIKFRNELVSAGSRTGDNAYIYGAPYNDLRYIRGTIPLGNRYFTIKGSMPNPPLFLARYFTKKLKEIGMVVEGSASTDQVMLNSDHKESINYESSELVYTHRSPSLLDIATRANYRSVNLYCESMLKVLGQEKKADGTIAAGLEVIKDYWKQKGLDFTGVFLEDGSGLSPRNGVPARFFTDLLRIVAKEPALADTFKSTLPKAGESGTLKKVSV